MATRNPDHKVYLPAKGLKEGDDITCLKVEVYYDLGGMSYFSGKNEKRGYIFSVIPMKVEAPGTNGMRFGSESCLIGRGLRCFIEAANRRSDKRLNAVAEETKRQIATKTGKAWEVIQQVCEREAIVLLDE